MPDSSLMPDSTPDQEGSVEAPDKSISKICFLGATQVGKTSFMRAMCNPHAPAEGRLKTVFSDRRSGPYLSPQESTATSGVRELDGILEFSNGKEIRINFIDLPGEWYTQMYRDKDASHAALERIRPFVNDCRYLYFFFSRESLEKDESSLRACLGVIEDYADTTGQRPYVSLVLTKCDLVPELKDLSDPGRERPSSPFSGMRKFLSLFIPQMAREPHEETVRKCIEHFAGDSHKYLPLIEKNAGSVHYSYLCVLPSKDAPPLLSPEQFNKLFTPFYQEVYTFPLWQKVRVCVWVIFIIAVAALIGRMGYAAWRDEKVNTLTANIEQVESKTLTKHEDWETYTAECDALADACSGDNPSLFDLRERLKERKLRLRDEACSLLREEFDRLYHAGQFDEAERLRSRYEAISGKQMQVAANSVQSEQLQTPSPIPPAVRDIPLLDTICNVSDYNPQKEQLCDHLGKKIEPIDAYLRGSVACAPAERERLKTALEWARVFRYKNVYELTVKLTGGWEADYDMACIVATNGTTGSSDEDYDDIPDSEWMTDDNKFTARKKISWQAGDPIRVSVYVNPLMTRVRRVGSFFYPASTMSIKNFCGKKKQNFNWSYEARWTDPFSEADVMSMEYSFDVAYKGSPVTAEIVGDVEQYVISGAYWRQKRDEAYAAKRAYEEGLNNSSR